MPSAIASATLAALVALIVGFPIMRLSGLAASIASLAVLGMFHTFYTNWSTWTMGAATLPGIPLYVDMWVALGWLVAALFVAYVYQRSRFGLALRAAREDEVAARAAGIDIAWQRLIAFVISAFFMGIGGVLQAHFIGSIAVKNFWLALTFVSLAMLIVGGQRSLTGAVVGAVAISAIVEVLRQLEEGIAARRAHPLGAARRAGARRRPGDAADPDLPPAGSDGWARDSLPVRDAPARPSARSNTSGRHEAGTAPGG